MVKKEWLTVEDVAKIEDVNVRTVQLRCIQNKLPCEKRGKKWFIDKQAYEGTRKKLSIINNPYVPFSNAKVKSVICLANNKGGVGKTTCAVMITDKLTLAGYNVLLVDLDPQGNATLLSGLKQNHGSKVSKNEYLYTLNDIMINQINKTLERDSGRGVSTKEAIYKSSRGFDVIATNISSAKIKFWLLDHADEFDHGLEIYNIWKSKFPYLLKNALEEVKNDYDYIVLDTPPDLSFESINAMMASSDVIIPTELGRFEVAGLRRVFNFVSDYSKYNKVLSILGIAITRYGPQRTTLDQELENQLRNSEFGPYLFDQIITRSLLVREATVNTMSVFDAWRTGLSKGSMESLDNFTEEVIIRLFNRQKSYVTATMEV